jgi:hypothetical protein
MGTPNLLEALATLTGAVGGSPESFMRRGGRPPSIDNLSGYLDKLMKYARLWAEDENEKGRKATILQGLCHAVVGFLKPLILQLGILEGPMGWALCWYNSCYILSKYLFLRQKTLTTSVWRGEGRHFRKPFPFPARALVNKIIMNDLAVIIQYLPLLAVADGRPASTGYLSLSLSLSLDTGLTQSKYSNFFRTKKGFHFGVETLFY